MSAPLSVDIAENRCRFRFNLVNRRLTSQLEDYIRIIQDKCQQQFRVLEIFWEKGQSPSSEIGQILSAIKKKRELTGLILIVSDNNKLQEHFVNNLRLVLSNNHSSLETFQLSIGCKCLHSDVLNPLLEAVGSCKGLRKFSIEVGEKNNLQLYQFTFKLNAIKLEEFRWKCWMQTDDSVQSFGQCLEASRECFATLKRWKLSLNIKQPAKNVSIPLEFLSVCEQLEQVSIKSNASCLRLTEKTLAGSIRRLRFKQRATTNVLQYFQTLTHLEEVKLEFIGCTLELCEELRGTLLQLVETNQQLQTLSLVLEVKEVTPAIIASLFQFSVKSFDLGFKILGEFKYEGLFALCAAAAGCCFSSKASLQLQTEQLTLTARITQSTYKLDAIENQVSLAMRNNKFMEVDQMAILATGLRQKGILDATISFDPCLTSSCSNYTLYKVDLYRKLFDFDWRYMKIKITNEFEIGRNELLVNVDDKTEEMLRLVLEKVEQGPINKLIIYHDSEVGKVFQRLSRLFHTKVFLCFCNYFMYTQMRTPEYTKVLKPCEKQAEIYQRRVLQFGAVLRKWGDRMRVWQLNYLLELTIPDVVIEETKREPSQLTPEATIREHARQQEEPEFIEPPVEQESPMEETKEYEDWIADIQYEEYEHESPIRDHGVFDHQPEPSDIVPTSTQNATTEHTS